MFKAWLVGLIILLNASNGLADVSSIVVVGLFNNVAVLDINNKQHIIRVGKAGPEGVKLISASSKYALIELNGVREKYFLASHSGGPMKGPPARASVSIWPTDGLYMTPGAINGFSVDFLVDTGASAVALNDVTAQRLGLDYQQGEVVGVKTASKVETAYRVTLNQVQVGDIVLYNVEAIVLENDEPQKALLGMSFLNQLEIIQSDERMDLKKRF